MAQFFAHDSSFVDNNVNIDLNSLIYNTQVDQDFKYRLVYVAITRARRNIKVFY